ncbi:TBC1 domain family member 12-like isoform X2 [Apis cerana]|uniref:TBC1 domain family member 12-like isoform X2 n=1 Tax=Apis cerana TaxID=7461 RepID=UPI0007E2D8F9|nr:TBC1 domain family member 12-like isoform X2 [Apis cerana]
MKNPISNHLNGNNHHSISSQNVSPCIVSRYGNMSNNYQVLKVAGRDSNCYIANNIVPKIGKQQLVSLNGSSISCNSVNINEALACDVASIPAVKTKALCVHIRENKWYDAGNVVSVGVAGTSLNHALESMSLAYNPTTKQIYSLEESNESQLDYKSQYLDSSCDYKEDSLNDNFKVDEDKYIRLESGSANSSPRNSLPRSCSSTVSSLSEVSPSGSFLGSDDQQVIERTEKSKRWGLNTLFSKNVFSWKNKDSQQSTPTSSPSRNIDKIGGSLALIQQPRPANLPAKNAIEEERHRKQYSAILEAARKRELREEKERKHQRELQLKEEERLAEDSHTWNVHILSKFENIKNTKKVRELWWRGLPPSVRGKVWKLAIPNNLNITTHLYNICLERAISSPISETLAAIKLDVFRTFPTLCVFQEGGPLSNSLQGILAAYAVYRPDVGYVQVAGLSPDLYLLDWLYTIYAKAMPLDVACRIWDVFLRDGDEFLFRTALGVLHLYQEELLKMDFVHGAQFLTRLPETLQAEALFNSISQMSTTVGTTTFQQMLVQFSSL